MKYTSRRKSEQSENYKNDLLPWIFACDFCAHYNYNWKNYSNADIMTTPNEGSMAAKQQHLLKIPFGHFIGKSLKNKVFYRRE